MYEEQFKRDLEKDVSSETSGHFRRLLVSVLQVRLRFCVFIVSQNYMKGGGLQANRDDSTTVDKDLAKKEARELLDVRSSSSSLFAVSLRDT